MADQVIGKIPDFTTDESVGEGIEEVKEPVVEETTEVKENTTELPAGDESQQTPGSAEGESTSGTEDTGTEQPKAPLVDEEALAKAVERATKGLRDEIVDLKVKLRTAAQGDRKLIQTKIDTVQDKIDDLQDINPNDRELIKKVLKAEGYMTKQEAQQLSYQTAQNQILNTFLDKYPEYKPENDPDNTLWNKLLGEFSLYAAPKDPTQIATLLERSHKAIQKPEVVKTSERNIPAQKRAVQVASAGAGGIQRSSSNVQRTFTAAERRAFEDGGWSEAEIQAMEKSLE